MPRLRLTALLLTLALLPVGSALAAAAGDAPDGPAAADDASAKSAGATTKPAAKGAGAPAASKPGATAAKPAPSACTPPTATSDDPHVFRDCQDSPEMVKIPSGSFQMGALGTNAHIFELPVHDVSIKAFAIGRYEVTWIEWLQCVRERGCATTPDDRGWGRGYRPVVGVSWYDAQEYIAWISRRTGKNYRLPTEAEWEYAARAGTKTDFSWGDGSSDACENANSLDITGQAAHPNWTWNIYCDDGFAQTAPVGSFRPNAFGLYDMLGNLWEWVQDCWHGDYTGAPNDGSAWIGGGDCDKRVNRGGGWSNNPRSLRTANRDADMPRRSGDAFGFRLVRDLEPGTIVPPIVPPPPPTQPKAVAR